MQITVLGAAGFIGTNLALRLMNNPNNRLRLVDTDISYFNGVLTACGKADICVCDYNDSEQLRSAVEGTDILYHLVSTVLPSTSDRNIADEITGNAVWTARLLDMCVEYKVKKVCFVSSGGTVYGKNVICPIREDAPTNPISSYGMQKLYVEKLLYLYGYMHGLDYSVVRLANPYGPYQRPNGMTGAVTTFVYKTLTHDDITVYGDGSVIRDFIYIDDVTAAMEKIALSDSAQRIYNLGSGYGTSLKQLLSEIYGALGIEMNVKYVTGRSFDVPENYLDISTYETEFGKNNFSSLKDGIIATADYMKKYII